MSQKITFLSGEGNMWYQRNKSAFTTKKQKEDPILLALEHCQIKPVRVLEIGCANGWRLAKLHDSYHCEVYGVDPSEEAITDGKTQYPYMNLSVGTADNLPEIEPVDLIIFGFCLYLCDPEDLFKIAMESHHLLKNNGHIAILDFHPPTGHYRNPYTHKKGIFSYKMDYSQLFTWHPSYCRVYQHLYNHQQKLSMLFDPNDIVSTQILRKDYSLSQGENPYKK